MSEGSPQQHTEAQRKVGVGAGVPTEGGKVEYKVQGRTFEVNKKYKVEKPIGFGAYGTVCSATDESTGKKVAIKKISKVFDDLTDGKRILREMKIIRSVSHPNLIKFIEFLRPMRKEDYSDVYIVTDLFESDLYKIVRSKQALTDDHFQFFLVQAVRGMHYLHSAAIMHRDLKPSNLLVNGDCKLAICDFGLARGSEDNNDQNMTEYVVTRWYRPPELLSLAGKYSTAIDVWSLGLIFGEMLSGRVVLAGKDYIHQLQLVLELLGTPTEAETSGLSDEAKKFISLQQPKKPKVLGELFPKATPAAVDLLSKMIRFHPSDRITTQQILDHPYLERLRDTTITANFKFSFEQEQVALSEADLRELMWTELLAASSSNE